MAVTGGVENVIKTKGKLDKKDIKNISIDKKDQIKYLELIDCPLKNQQLDIFNYHIKNNHIPDITENDLDEYSEDDTINEEVIKPKQQQAKLHLQQLLLLQMIKPMKK